MTHLLDGKARPILSGIHIVGHLDVPRWVCKLGAEASMAEISVIELDLAMHLFEIHRVDASGRVVISKQLRRAQVPEFFGRQNLGSQRRCCGIRAGAEFTVCHLCSGDAGDVSPAQG